jgi:hypothetical protein
MKIIFVLILVIHGLIHLMGFAKAFGYGSITQITQEIPMPIGILWLATALLFVVTTFLFLRQKYEWSIVGIIAVIISQILIFLVWQDAKFGTLANLIILVVAVLSLGSHNFEHSYQQDVRANLKRVAALPIETLVEADLQPLPEPVQRYLRYVGVLNKPKVKNVRIVFDGKMRDKGKEFFPFISEQYNFFDEPTRLFFMKARMFGLTIPGYHKYSNAQATMDIRMFGLFPIIKQSGEIMNKTETVTLFNDMCLMAPATLIDKRIQWQQSDPNSVKATFTNQGISISAVLYFNEQGQLVDFQSNDRTATSDMKQHPFYTPVSAYQNVEGVNIMSYGEAIYQYPDGKFTYGEFFLREIEYNPGYFDKTNNKRAGYRKQHSQNNRLA